MIPHVQGQRRSCNKMVGGVKLHLESNPIPAREAQKAQKKKKKICEPGPRDPTETEPDLPLSVGVSPAEAKEALEEIREGSLNRKLSENWRRYSPGGSQLLTETLAQLEEMPQPPFPRVLWAPDGAFHWLNQSASSWH